ncbi:MAG TPA: hypothetical protein VMF11_14710 [Candidatus Baltobacteraceae bacterium]|nr:hypothetical protein [Candidatus Baltobacteraceae bacterium]
MTLTGVARRQLLMLTTLYFAILFLESEVSHMPLLSAGMSLAILPVVWLAVSLLALIAVQLWPSAVMSRFLQVAMIGAAIVGIVGVFPHLAANGVTWNHLGALASPALMHGEPGPQWPLAIAMGGVLGYLAGYGVERDQEFIRTGTRWPTWIAFALVVIGTALSESLTTLGWGSSVIVVASLLLLVITLAEIIAAARGEV